jgi:hypothetical protein
LNLPFKFWVASNSDKIRGRKGEEDGEEDDNAEGIELFCRVRDFNERDACFGFCTEL